VFLDSLSVAHIYEGFCILVSRGELVRLALDSGLVYGGEQKVGPSCGCRQVWSAVRFWTRAVVVSSALVARRSYGVQQANSLVACLFSGVLVFVEAS
jgi:hypothetical protein